MKHLVQRRSAATAHSLSFIHPYSSSAAAADQEGPATLPARPKTNKPPTSYLSRWLLTFGLIGLLISCGQSGTKGALEELSSQPSTTASYSPSSLIVKLAPGLSERERQALFARHGVSETSSVPALWLHFVEVTQGDTDEVMTTLSADSQVISVERDTLRETPSP